jgi:hypothetical protein
MLREIEQTYCEICFENKNENEFSGAFNEPICVDCAEELL